MSGLGTEGHLLGDVYYTVNSVLALPVLALGSEIRHWLTSSLSFSTSAGGQQGTFHRWTSGSHL